MIDKQSAKLLDECTDGQWRQFVHPSKIEKPDGYIDGVHCGDKDCYACGTQRYNCDELNRLDKENDGDTN